MQDRGRYACHTMRLTNTVTHLFRTVYQNSVVRGLYMYIFFALILRADQGRL